MKTLESEPVGSGALPQNQARRVQIRVQRMARRIQCAWRGHEPDPYGMGECVNCERALSYDEYVAGCIKDKLGAWWKRRTEWVKTCPECGRRFGKHDESVEHIPF